MLLVYSAIIIQQHTRNDFCLVLVPESAAFRSYRFLFVRTLCAVSGDFLDVVNNSESVARKIPDEAKIA